MTNKKGFTLIELLAVIIILGVLLLIVVPAVSRYMEDSRKGTYVTNLEKIVDAVSTKVNSYDDGYVFSTSEYLVVPISCVELERGSNTNSPFGPYIKEQSFVLVTRKEDGQGFEYYVSAKDEIGYGTKIALAGDIEIKKVNDDEVGKITEEGVELRHLSSMLSNKSANIKTCESFDIEISDDNNTSSTLRNKILEDNEEQSDASIDFSQTSKQDGTSGLYYTSTNTENNGTTYYFRGAVDNNYVSFAGFYWRIIRINEDGSIRLIYQGETADETGNAATIGSSVFNSNNNDNANVGYMYGETGSYTYSATHANTNNSTIKTAIDTWYVDNLLDNYATYLADSGFCGDRSIASEPNLGGSWDTALGYGRNITYYGAHNRLDNNKPPQFSCPQENDLYTTSSSTKGNKALDYPIGLIVKFQGKFSLE